MPGKTGLRALQDLLRDRKLPAQSILIDGSCTIEVDGNPVMKFAGTKKITGVRLGDVADQFVIEVTPSHGMSIVELVNTDGYWSAHVIKDGKHEGYFPCKVTLNHK